MLSHIGVAALTFVVTNIDDLLLLSLYFSNPEYKTKNIVAGQYLGIITLIAISLLGIVLGTLLESHWISFLGIVPLGLGIMNLVQLFKQTNAETESSPSTRSNYQILNVALITIANGGDNIGVYTPLFANLEMQYFYVYPLSFLLLTGAWCWLAYSFVNHPRVKHAFSRFGKYILPVFLICLGLYLMTDFGWWVFSL